MATKALKVRPELSPAQEVVTAGMTPGQPEPTQADIVAAKACRRDQGLDLRHVVRFYKLTRKGRAQMADEEASWARLAGAVASIIGGAAGENP